jgi:hypothetical protein
VPIKFNSPVTRFSLFAWILFILIFTIENINGRFWLNDFRVYYSAAGAMMHSQPFYGVSFGLDSGLYKYSPVILFLFAPASVLPFHIACILHFIFLSLCTWGSFLVIRQIMNRWVFMKAIPNEGLMLSLALTGICIHLVRELHLGNVNSLLLLLSCLVLLALLEKKDTTAGILFGVIILFKPFFIFLFIPLLLRKRWRAFASLCGTIAAGLVLPALVFGMTGNISIHREWITNLLSHNEGYESYQSLWSVIRNNLLPGIPGYFQYVVFIAGGLFAVVFTGLNLRRERHETGEAGAGADLAMEWFIMLAMIPSLVKTDTEHFMASAPLLVFLFYYLSSEKKLLPAMVLAVLLFFFGGNSTDLLGRDLSDTLFRAGLTGIANLLMIAMTLIVYFRGAKRELSPFRNG